MAMPIGNYVYTGAYGPFYNAGAPSAGTNEVVTITFGGTPTGGTFKLGFEGFTTATIAWSATNNTLVANIDAALKALPNIGASGVTTAVGTMTAGIGTITVTFGGDNAHKAISTITVADNSLTGTSPTLAVAKTTPGVNATIRRSLPGATMIDTTNAKHYTNTGTPLNPTWTVTGTQS